MGKLSTFKHVTTEVEVGDGQTITVRGLSITDIGSILHEHANTLDALYQEHIVGDGTSETPEMDTLIRALMTEAPQAVAAIIAYANDEPEMADVVLTMPGMDQIKLLLEIARLTFKSEEEVGNVVATLIHAMRVATTTANKISGQASLEA